METALYQVGGFTTPTSNFINSEDRSYIEMFYLAIALTAALAQGGPIDDHHATVIVNQFAHKLGLPALKVETQERSAEPDWKPGNIGVQVDIVKCVDPNGEEYSCRIIPPSDIISLVTVRSLREGSTSTVTDVTFDPAKPPKEYDPRPLGEKALKAIGAKGPFKYRPMRVANPAAKKSAIFDRTISGHRFLSMSPIYSYFVQVDMKSSKVLGIAMPAELPPVNAKSAKVDGAKAKKALEDWANENKRDYASILLHNQAFGKNSLVMELGYYKFRNQTTATLVWQGRISQVRHDGQKLDPICLSMLVDATTGELVKPDTNQLVN